MFVGDLVDRGPRVVDVLRLVMASAAAGAAFAVVLAGPSLREWYWMVPLAMLALVRDTRAYAACIVASGYAVLSLPFAEYGFGAVALHEKVLLATATGVVLTALWLATAGRWGLRLRRVRRIRTGSLTAAA